MGVNRTSSIAAILVGAALAVAAPAPRSGPAAPDLLFFSRRVAADLHTHCAGCHSDPESSGSYRLAPLDNLVRPSRELLLKNYRATLAFLDPVRPERSLLLRKARGAAGHGGGALLTRGSRDYVALVQLAQGATLANLPPEAILEKRVEAVAGEPVRIDGTLSGDPDGDTLHYAWSAPESGGGRLALRDGAGGVVSATAPGPGLYRVELRVSDGRLASLPATAVVVVRESRPAPRPAGEEASPEPRADAPEPRPRPATSSDFVAGRLDPRRLKLIRRLYYDLKWRGPRLEELQRWYPRTHEEMVDAFLADEETWAAWYERQLYYFLLLDRFRPKAHRLTTLPERVAKKEADVPRALQEIVRSQFFNARNPGNDTYCTVVLEQCLGMVVQERRGRRALERAKRMYDGYKTRIFRTEGRSQADFVRIVFRQPALFEHLLARTYRDLHGEEIDRRRLEREAEVAAKSPFGFREVLREWLRAPAYAGAVGEARTKGEIPFVRALFLDTLGRLPGYEELRDVRNAFLSLADPTPIRLVMGRMLLESREARVPRAVADPRAFVRRSFLRLLARPPTDAELAAFAGGLEDDPRVTPRVVLWTLLSSAEYQTY